MVDPPSLWMPCATFFKGDIPPRCRISFPDHTICIGIPVLSQYVDQEALAIPLLGKCLGGCGHMLPDSFLTQGY